MSGHRWTPDEMRSLTGTTAVVTGANSGIGWYTALELARHAASVTLAVRTPAKGEAAAARIRQQVPGADVRVRALDLGSLDSVRAFAEDWQGPLGLLVNNAGLMMPPRYQQTRDGFELQFGTNHLGHFALTGRLLPALLAAPAPRVVTVSSIAHHRGKADVLDGNPAERYNPSATYGNSKLANLLFALELQRRAALAGASLTSTAAHPGVSHTGLVTSEQGMGSIPGVKQLAPLVSGWSSSRPAPARSPRCTPRPRRTPPPTPARRGSARPAAGSDPPGSAGSRRTSCWPASCGRSART